MQFSKIIAVFGLLSTSLAVAVPAVASRQTVFACGTGTAQCCDVDVLGIADLDCTTRELISSFR